MTDTFNAARMELARRRRGLTKKALADAAGIPTPSITLYTQDRRLPDPTTVERMAQVLHFPTEFFYAPTLDEPARDGTSFRALSRLTTTLQDQALAAGALAIGLSQWIDQHFTLPKPSIPDYAGIDPEDAAMAVRTEWGMGEQPVANMVHRLEAHGVRVYSIAEGTHDLDAFSCWVGDAPYVFLSTVKSSERSRMDAAHELGHLVLHRRQQGPGNRVAEREADAFGSAFLMPRGSVLASAPLHGRLWQLIRAKRNWGVSVANLTYRMHKVGMLTEWEYRTLFREISRRGFRDKEPEPMQNEIPQVLAKVFGTLRDDAVSLNQVAKELHVYPDDLSKSIFHIVLTPVAGGGQSISNASPPPDLRLV